MGLYKIMESDTEILVCRLCGEEHKRGSSTIIEYMPICVECRKRFIEKIEQHTFCPCNGCKYKNDLCNNCHLVSTDGRTGWVKFESIKEEGNESK